MKVSGINLWLYFLMVCFSCDTKKDYEGDFKKYFIKYYGEDGTQEGIDLIATQDTVWLLGTTRTDNNVSRIMLIQTDGEGNVRWEKKFGETRENARDIELTPAGDFLILSNMFLGQDIGTNEDLYKFKVLRVSRNGTKLDSVVFGNVWTTQFAHAVTALSNGDFIVTGNTTDENFLTDTGLPPPDQEDLMAVVFNSDNSVRTTNVSTSAEYTGAVVKAFQKSSDQFYLFTYSDRLTSGGDTKYESNFNPFILTNTGSLPTDAQAAGTGTRDEILKYVCRMPGGFYEIGTSSVLPQTVGMLYYTTRSDDLSLIDEGTVDAGDNLIAA
ncbi:MAG TPA: hypothetical protein VD816_04565, partial [Ohtaekwangia sp.]|nr:hypothetical protein [Ohtaekwangia sp.]